MIPARFPGAVGSAKYPRTSPAGPGNVTLSARTSGSSTATDNAAPPLTPPVAGVTAVDPGVVRGRGFEVLDDEDDDPSSHAARNAVARVTDPQIPTSRVSSSRRETSPVEACSTTSDAA